ncbi:MAG: TolC family protein [Elusimicrobiota bacterium]
MRSIFILIAFMAPPGAAFTQPTMSSAPLTLTLEQAIDLAMKENIDVALAELDLRAFQSRYREVVGAAIPNLALTGSYTRNFKKPVAFFGGRKTEIGELNSMQGGVELEQTIYSGGKLMAGLNASRLRVASGQDSLRAAREEVTLAVKRIFYSVLLASATASIQEDNLRSAEEHLATIRERYRQGLDSDLTVLRQEVELANAKPSLIQARNLFELGLTLLKDVLGLDVDYPVILEGRLDIQGANPPLYESLVKVALERNPDYQAARKRAEAAFQLVRVAAGDYQPQLSLFANYLWTAQSPDISPGPEESARSSAGGLRLSFPFFTGGETLERVRQAKIDRQRAQEAMRKAERAVRVEVKRQWLTLREAQERAVSQEAAIGQARRALEATEVRYKAGQASQLELNDATLAFNRARIFHAQALHDDLAALAALERAVGIKFEEVNP